MRPSGFSLIELLIGVAVLSILVSLAAPSFKVWLQNAQIRNAAESIQNGLQRARAEAVSLNTNVEFVLTDLDASCIANSSCSSWTVKLAGGANIETRSSKEGSAGIVRTTVPPTSNTITFNNVGSAQTPSGNNADGSAPFTAVTLDSTALPPADSRELIIRIGVGGNAKMCDPNITHGPRAC
jgi:type IV fimbrial biogenesis protein FimT